MDNAPEPPPGDAEHCHAQLHLPWYVTGRLDAAEQARVAMHVAGCAACRADLALEVALAGHEPQALPLSAEDGWARLSARLEAPAGRFASAAGRLQPRVRALVGDWRTWAIAAQLALNVLLGLHLVHARPEAEVYRVLGRPPAAAGGDVLVMFAPATPERTFRELLTGVEARVVDGPTVTGAYVLRIPAAGRQAALASLRASPGVTLAEPLDPEARP